MIDEKILNDMLEQLHEQIEDIEIDIEDLDSTIWDDNPFCIEDHLIGSSGDYEYDEDEYTSKQYEEMIECIEHDGLYEYVEDYSEEVCKEYESIILDKLQKEKDMYGY